MSSEENDQNDNHDNDYEEETNQRVRFEYIELYPEQLEPHPVNLTLYGEEKVDQTLVYSILCKGLLEPLVIKEEIDENENKKYFIISGHRRWRALKHINEKELEDIVVDDKNDTEKPTEFVKRKVKCQIAFFKDEIEEKKAIVEYNRRRKKRDSQLYNEIEMLHEIYDLDAISRSRINLKNFLNNSPLTVYRRIIEAVKRGEIDKKIIDWDGLSKEEIAFEYGYLVDGPMGDYRFDKSLIEEGGRTVEKISKDLGYGKTYIQNLTKVGRFAYEFGDEFAVKAMKYLDQGYITLNGAYIMVTLRNRYLARKEPGAIVANRLVQKIEEGIQNKINKIKGERLTPAAAMKQFKEMVPDYDSDPEPKVQKTTLQRTVYSVIYVIPFLSDSYNESLEPDIRSLESDVMPDYLANIRIPAAKNAALYLIASNGSIKHYINLFRIWNFKLQTFNVIDFNEEEGYGILLFGTKGNWVIPDGESKITYHTILDFDKIPDHLKKLYPDVNSFYQIPSNGGQPEGWGKPFEEVKSEPPEEDENVSEETSNENVNKEFSGNGDSENKEFSGNGDSESKEHIQDNMKDKDHKKSYKRGSAGEDTWL